MAEWQTQQTQNLPGAISYGFKSRLRHHIKSTREIPCFFSFIQLYIIFNFISRAILHKACAVCVNSVKYTHHSLHKNLFYIFSCKALPFPKKYVIIKKMSYWVLYKPLIKEKANVVHICFFQKRFLYQSLKC